MSNILRLCVGVGVGFMVINQFFGHPFQRMVKFELIRISFLVLQVPYGFYVLLCFASIYTTWCINTVNGGGAILA